MCYVVDILQGLDAAAACAVLFTSCARWKGDGEGRCSRTFEFIQPKKGIASANATCVQEQRFSVHVGGVFVMTTDMSMTGIPYADSFRVQSFWKVRVFRGRGAAAAAAVELTHWREVGDGSFARRMDTEVLPEVQDVRELQEVVGVHAGKEWTVPQCEAAAAAGGADTRWCCCREAPTNSFDVAGRSFEPA
jgi:hypothetical protein